MHRRVHRVAAGRPPRPPEPPQRAAASSPTSGEPTSGEPDGSGMAAPGAVEPPEARVSAALSPRDPWTERASALDGRNRAGLRAGPCEARAVERRRPRASRRHRRGPRVSVSAVPQRPSPAYQPPPAACRRRSLHRHRRALPPPLPRRWPRGHAVAVEALVALRTRPPPWTAPWWPAAAASSSVRWTSSLRRRHKLPAIDRKRRVDAAVGSRGGSAETERRGARPAKVRHSAASHSRRGSGVRPAVDFQQVRTPTLPRRRRRGAAAGRRRIGAEKNAPERSASTSSEPRGLRVDRGPPRCRFGAPPLRLVGGAGVGRAPLVDRASPSPRGRLGTFSKAWNT
mmetsp:Transcript_31092/g.107467  ORF Transcript_31092/g.107467 Transcript_31092/m.107467 type:complete len:341 (+) Transcript_31092:87-1109(+)